MNLIDTHAHLQFEAYDEDRSEVVKRNSRELDAIINVGASIDTSKKAIELSSKIKNFYASVGIHPHHFDQWNESTYSDLKKLAENEKVIAVGEIGLDKHEYQGYPKPDLSKQTKILLEQIELGEELNLPILFHCRAAYDELFEVVKSYNNIEGLVHCFMGTGEQAKKFLGLGLYISFSGNITYKGNDYIREAAKLVPLDKILVETDSPYLPPEPHRGERNEPLYVKIVVEAIAKVKQIDFEKIAGATNQNSRSLLIYEPSDNRQKI